MPDYTVIGLVDNTTVPPSLTVAAVLAGRVEAVDLAVDTSDAQRWAETLDAADPVDAESRAHATVMTAADDSAGPAALALSVTDHRVATTV